VSWIVVDPRYAMDSNTKVALVRVPFFSDEVDYESIVGRAFEGDQFAEWRARGTLVLTTETAYEKLEKVMGGSWGDVPESTVVNETRALCLERQAVVLKWLPGERQ
jgi:hypothetical protein